MNYKNKNHLISGWGREVSEKARQRFLAYWSAVSGIRESGGTVVRDELTEMSRAWWAVGMGSFQRANSENISRSSYPRYALVRWRNQEKVDS